MAMIPDDEIERIKRETDLAAVIRSRGVALTQKGGDLIGLCPFHKDENPSLHVTPAKRLWRWGNSKGVTNRQLTGPIKNKFSCSFGNS